MSLFMVFALKALPRTAAFVVANVAAALLFGAGHLPLAMQFGGGAAVITYTVLANAVAGLTFGWLFYRRGLEQAIVAHAWADVVLHGLPLMFFSAS
jgi:membrane protease YdiL (CAAX protease family)